MVGDTLHTRARFPDFWTMTALQPLRIALWNIEWRTPTSLAGQLIRRHLATWNPDLICLTESHAHFLEGGHQVESGEDYGYGAKVERRKVLLWSRWPWRDVGLVGSPGMPPGRFISGVTATPLGQIEVIGVCIPWSHAHVTGGRRDCRPWDEHVTYIQGLAPLLASEPEHPRILLGDFNQRIPRVSQPEQAYKALSSAISPGLRVATAGAQDATGRAAIDHLAHTLDLTAKVVGNLPRREPDGPTLSDHFGLVLEVSPTDPSSGHADPVS